MSVLGRSVIDLDLARRNRMSASQFRSQLDRKRRQRVEAEKKAGEYRTKESQKRAEAAKARQAAAKAKSETTAKRKLREAERREKEAETAGKEAGRRQTKASGYAKEESALTAKLARAEQSEADAAERRRKREQQQAGRRAAAERATLESRISDAESSVDHVVRQLRAPKPENLRVLILGASAEGDLRVGREQKRIRTAVESALHRDQIDLDVRPAATTADLLDGITKFRPHVVHFSGHSNEDGDAINYAAQFYAAIANGQSIRASHLSGQAALELAGLNGSELPSLAWAHGVDPATTILVKPASS